MVAERGGALGRSDDVDKQHRSERSLGLLRMSPSRQEVLDMIGERAAASAHPPHMVLTRKLDQFRSGNVPGEVARVPDLAYAVRGTMQDKRWRANRRQDLPNVDFAIHL